MKKGLGVDAALKASTAAVQAMQAGLSPSRAALAGMSAVQVYVDAAKSGMATIEAEASAEAASKAIMAGQTLEGPTSTYSGNADDTSSDTDSTSSIPLSLYASYW